ncbi:uncharacterized protein LOC124395473 [Silurus meridionalis]|uniref:uncharacterized protein LOC124395473 n=1 Tax=Silurus meridionalis TaxID=175797 RepID=UPI001EEA4927|nr:uncharacterized protein LOC124395473 [Silurus meridionalis]
MGNSYPKPEPEETPSFWIQRCGLTYYVTPYLDNLAGWTEVTPHIPPYPREGTFDPGYLASAYRMIYEGIGDPQWENSYMEESYGRWYDMKKIWDESKKIYTPNRVFKAIPKPPKNKCCVPPTSPPVSPTNPPPYSGDAKKLPLLGASALPPPSLSVPKLYPSLAALKAPATEKTSAEKNKKKGLKKNRKARNSGDSSSSSSSSSESSDDNSDLDNVGPDAGTLPDPPPWNAACVWVAKPSGVQVTPPSPSALKDIIGLLPSPDKPLPFVDMLIKSSRNCQLTGADYRFILQNKLGDSYNEEMLVQHVPVLSHENDEVVTEVKTKTEGGGDEEARKEKSTKVKSTLFWKDNPRALTMLKDQLTKYLLSIKQANRDLSQVTNCKQEKNEPASGFFNRFSQVWQHLGGLDLVQTDSNPLFLSTFCPTVA